MGDKKITHEDYSADWIDSAWGSDANRELASGRRVVPRPRVARALELMDIRPGMRMLDIACGRGEVPAIISQMRGWAIGLDYAQSSIDFSRKVRTAQREAGNTGGNYELVRGDARALPFQSNLFDRVSMLDIIEHLEPDGLEMMLREVRRVLKPDGYAVIHTLPNRWVYDVTYPVVHKIWRSIPKNPRGPFDSKIHVNEQDLMKLNRMLTKCDFTYHVWLEQFIARQARWNKNGMQYRDTRGKVYPALAGIGGRVLETLSHTPLKLLLSNDIFGVLWKGSARPTMPALPIAVTECAVRVFS